MFSRFQPDQPELLYSADLVVGILERAAGHITSSGAAPVTHLYLCKLPSSVSRYAHFYQLWNDRETVYNLLRVRHGLHALRCTRTQAVGHGEGAARIQAIDDAIRSLRDLLVAAGGQGALRLYEREVVRANEIRDAMFDIRLRLRVMNVPFTHVTAVDLRGEALLLTAEILALVGFRGYAGMTHELDLMMARHLAGHPMNVIPLG